MNQNKDVPDIKLLDAINPKERDGYLVSPNLFSYIQEYVPKESAMWQAFMDTEDESLEERYYAGKLASLYLMQTAAQGQATRNNLWIDRFNQSVEEMYGLPDPAEAAYLMEQESLLLNRAAPNSFPAQTYRNMVAGANFHSREEFSLTELEPFRRAIFDKLHVIVETIENLDDKTYSPKQVREIFQTILNGLAAEDPGWKDWKITNTPGKKMLSVRSAYKEIEVPDDRPPVGSNKELLGLAMHEIGVHAMRSVKGYQTEDDLMAKGLPDGQFEEGMATIIEFMCTGVIPQKIIDRYIDVALASGVINGVRLSRQDILHLGVERQAIRDRSQGKIPDIDQITNSVKVHVDRIFRGGDGQPVTDESGRIVKQAVFTKDTDYYASFINAYDYITGAIKDGFPIHRLIDYLYAGKFDPTNERHVAYLNEKHSIAL